MSNILAVVPARSGSKGLPGKNIRPFLGRPLVAHVKDVIVQVPEISRAIISTDREDIAAASGLACLFKRPAHLCEDIVSDIDVLQHATVAAERQFRLAFDVVVMLQPTCPLRRPEHVKAAIQKLLWEHLDSVWTVSPVDLSYHPLKQLSLYGEHDSLMYFHPQGPSIIARQQLTPTYKRNGAAYVLTRACLFAGKLMGDKAGAVVIEDELVSIDTEGDFVRAERLGAAQQNNSAQRTFAQVEA